MIRSSIMAKVITALIRIEKSRVGTAAVWRKIISVGSKKFSCRFVAVNQHTDIKIVHIVDRLPSAIIFVRSTEHVKPIAFDYRRMKRAGLRNASAHLSIAYKLVLYIRSISNLICSYLSFSFPNMEFSKTRASGSWLI